MIFTSYQSVLFISVQLTYNYRTINNNFNPAFNEEFDFSCSLEEVSQKSLIMRIWDEDMIGKNDPIGEIVIPLWQVRNR